MDYINGNNRNQIQFFAPEEMVTSDSRARVIDTFVDLLPLSEPGFKHAAIKKEGRPPYDPSLLLRLYLYGTTDPEAKAMRVSNNGTEVSHLIQSATDAGHNLFVHADIRGVSDKRELTPIALAVKHLPDLKGFKTLSDAGYSTGEQLHICKENSMQKLVFAQTVLYGFCFTPVFPLLS